MLNKIRSKYILKYIFFYIIEKRQLQLAYYNKILQSNLGKSLINYKILSGKYIIYETNTRAKIYNAYNDEIIYEGEYLNGKRNGIGKEYYDTSVLKFEGEYLNNTRNGKGKEYYGDGVLKFEVEYLNGEIWNMMKIKIL